VVKAVHLLKSIQTAELCCRQVWTTTFQLHFDRSVNVQGMCRQLAIAEEGSEDKKYWYSSFSTL